MQAAGHCVVMFESLMCGRPASEVIARPHSVKKSTTTLYPDGNMHQGKLSLSAKRALKL